MANLKLFTILLLGLLYLPSALYGQTVTGTVVDAANNEPLIGVNIILQGTAIGTTTDFDGNFSLNVPDLQGVLVFRYVGFVTQEIPLEGRTELNIRMREDTFMGSELVVVAYGIQQRSLVTGAISRIESAQIQQAAPLRVEQALQGRTAGVLVMQNSGQPGSGATVRIRGIGTTGDAEPLYVVDGMPVTGIDFLNPADISSIEVLKDASATAIYGARGANGVVMITTKSGRPGDIQVSYNAYVGFQNPWRQTDLLNAPDYMMIMNESYANDNRTIPFPDIDERIQSIGNGTNWQDEVFFYNAPLTNHSLSFAGGSGNSTYVSSFSYRQQDGIVARGASNYERFTARLNSDHTAGRLNYGSRINYTRKTARGIDPNEEFGGVMSRVANIDPVTPVRNEDGSFAQSPFASQEVVNPVAAIDIINSRNQEDKFVGGVYGRFRLMDNLFIRSSFDVDMAFINNRAFTPEFDLGGNVANSTTIAFQEQVRFMTWQTSHVLQFDNSFGNHEYSAIAGFELLDRRTEFLGGTRSDLSMPSFTHAWLSTGIDPDSQTNYGGLALESLASYFTRVNYNYAGKYILEGVFRMDGSSKFGPDNRWATFPAFSLGWVISRENFMSEFRNLSELRLRGGWGQNGSDNIGQFGFTPLITTHAGYGFGADPTVVTGAYPGRIANTNLKWETSEQLSVGLEAAFYDFKYFINLDFYQKQTKGLLLSAPIPAFIGNAAPIVNGGTVRNTGFELEAGVRDIVGNLNYDLTLTGTYNVNEITAISNEEGRLFGANVSTSMNSVAMAQVGFPIAFFWGFQTAGIFQSEEDVLNHVNEDGVLIQPNARPGDLIFVDQNGDGQITDEDRVKIGNPYPDFTLGFNINLGWKNWDLNMFIYGAFGQDIFTGGTRRHDLNMPNWKASVLDRWTPENTNTSHPRVTINDPNGNFSRPSDFFIEDGSFVRLRNAAVGYTLPGEWVNRIGARRMRVYAAAQNLFTITGYSGHDPEIGSRGALDVGIDRNIYPQARTYMFGVNLDF
ncbi:MAG: TonB-dependent receptor [Candidatus Cyclonatronum sp.]|uniref:SusC/RagA family TonB-linked outer membrane protein n=1 Tax=Cyclonatronum sp. TaxID=3024185 RepID=UPI0025C16EDC|nr:TonB-dependent receptor [Cyclonatronum sp.]MCH8486943.1 TonB-dependent receptor [Cyclonatronum sp.]